MALGINKSLAIRIFSIFDSDCDGGITFQVRDMQAILHDHARVLTHHPSLIAMFPR